jgi:DNA-binding transcriptional LysR family regulator
MNSRSLETLLWIVRLGGIGAAAKHLNLTQPAITRRVHELERDLGAKLFRREGRHVVLTRAGQSCVKIAERIVADVAIMRFAASGNSAISGTIRIGVGEVIALSWLDLLLARIGDSYPKIDLVLDVDLAGRLDRKLRTRQIDIALLPGPVSLPGVVTTDLGSCITRWMSHPDFLRIDGILRPEDLVDVPILTFSHDSYTHILMERWFDEAGVKPRRINHCNSLSVVTSLVQKKVGVSLLPQDLCRSFIEAGTMMPVLESPPVGAVEYSAAYLPTTELVVLPQIASFAREVSCFLCEGDERWRELTVESFAGDAAQVLDEGTREFAGSFRGNI